MGSGSGGRGVGGAGSGVGGVGNAGSGVGGMYEPGAGAGSTGGSEGAGRPYPEGDQGVGWCAGLSRVPGRGRGSAWTVSGTERSPATYGEPVDSRLRNRR